MDSTVDYRFGGERNITTYFYPISPETSSTLTNVFKRMVQGSSLNTGGKDTEAKPYSIPVMQGRQLYVPLAANGIAKFTFNDLCDASIGAADYIAICEHFHTVIIEGIPMMDSSNRDQLRRFVVLIDELYQSKVKVIASGADKLENIFQADEGEAGDVVSVICVTFHGWVLTLLQCWADICFSENHFPSRGNAVNRIFTITSPDTEDNIINLKERNT